MALKVKAHLPMNGLSLPGKGDPGDIVAGAPHPRVLHTSNPGCATRHPGHGACEAAGRGHVGKAWQE